MCSIVPRRLEPARDPGSRAPRAAPAPAPRRGPEAPPRGAGPSGSGRGGRSAGVRRSGERCGAEVFPARRRPGGALGGRRPRGRHAARQQVARVEQSLAHRAGAGLVGAARLSGGCPGRVSQAGRSRCGMRVARGQGELAQRGESENERGGAGCAGADHAANVVAASGPGNDARFGSRPFTVVPWESWTPSSRRRAPPRPPGGEPRARARRLRTPDLARAENRRWRTADLRGSRSPRSHPGRHAFRRGGRLPSRPRRSRRGRRPAPGGPPRPRAWARRRPAGARRRVRRAGASPRR